MPPVKILLVDDEEIIRVAWTAELETAGYQVRSASRGEQALQLAKEERPDIVITDLVMPGISGVEVCRELKEIYPDVEVVFVSGHPSELEKNLLNFIRVGGREEFLRKPLLEDELIRTIEKVVKEKREGAV